MLREENCLLKAANHKYYRKSNVKIQKIEKQDIEFKKSWRDEYLKWICAFSNT